jgi:hypothetical protein
VNTTVFSSALNPGEEVLIAEGVPQIVRYRAGASSRPLVVFLPGGGHLARVTYGHAGARSRDFIDVWLQDEGFALLALSYPSDHPAFERRLPALSIVDWAKSSAALIAACMKKGEHSEVVVLAWSMAGRSVVALERALRKRGVRQLCFVSLAATPPLPGFMPEREERFTDEGFWDSGTRHAQWLPEVGAVIDERTYLAEYLVNSPFGLRGQVRTHDPHASLMLAHEIGAFAYEDYPLLAAVVPDSARDRQHALTDVSIWGTLNVLRLTRLLGAHGTDSAHSAHVSHGVHGPQGAHGAHGAHGPHGAHGAHGGHESAEWQPTRRLVDQLPQRLSRPVQGGHFFFIGEQGARKTARAVVELIAEARNVQAEIEAFTRPAPSPS